MTPAATNQKGQSTNSDIGQIQNSEPKSSSPSCVSDVASDGRGCGGRQQDYGNHVVTTGVCFDASRGISIGTARSSDILCQISVGEAIAYIRSADSQQFVNKALECSGRIQHDLRLLIERFGTTGNFDFDDTAELSNLWPSQRKDLAQELTNVLKESGEQVEESTRSKLKAIAWRLAKAMRLSGFMWAGTFGLRNNHSLVRSSGLMCVDLDKLKVDIEKLMKDLMNDALIFWAARSPSGKGVKVLVRIPDDAALNEKNYLACFETVERYIAAKYPGVSISVDKQAKAVAQLCFFMHDPESFWNPDAYILHPDEDLMARHAEGAKTNKKSSGASGSTADAKTGTKQSTAGREPQSARGAGRGFPFDSYPPDKQWEVVRSAVESMEDWIAGLPSGQGERNGAWTRIGFSFGEWLKQLRDENICQQAKAWLLELAGQHYAGNEGCVERAMEGSNGTCGLGTLFMMAKEHGGWKAPWSTQGAEAWTGQARQTGEDDLDKQRKIAEDVLGPINWQNETEGFCTCPGIESHTTGDNEKNCKVTLNKGPTVSCPHKLCRDVIAEKNRELRVQIIRADCNPNFLILPSGNVTITDCARDIFSTTHDLYFRGGEVAELIHEDGTARLKLVKPDALRTRVERLGRPLLAWRKGRNGDTVLAHAKMSTDDAKAILCALDACELLPHVASIVGCPVITSTGEVLGSGYHAHAGGLLIDGGKRVPIVPYIRAVEYLLGLIEEFEFVSPGDEARALAGQITPALRMGGILDCRFPILVNEADFSQAGKGYLHDMTAAIYNDVLSLVIQKKGGVGSTEESLDSALVAGRPFISLDNLRGKLDSPRVEAFLTAPGLFSARIPYHGDIMVHPKRFILMMTSNGVETTRDLANRASITRIKKREGYAYRAILEEIRQHQPFYLGCIFSIVRQWLKMGRPKTADTRHDFREWSQSLDWIVQNLLGCKPLMDGHQEAQIRVSNPALSFFRACAIAVESDGKLDVELTASNLVEIAQLHDIDIPGVKNDADDRTCAQVIGGLGRRAFRDSNTIKLEGYAIERGQKRYQKNSGNWDETPCYTFSQLG